jgi:hypothetical protein
MDGQLEVGSKESSPSVLATGFIVIIAMFVYGVFAMFLSTSKWFR